MLLTIGMSVKSSKGLGTQAALLYCNIGRPLCFDSFVLFGFLFEAYFLHVFMFQRYTTLVCFVSSTSFSDDSCHSILCEEDFSGL